MIRVVFQEVFCGTLCPTNYPQSVPTERSAVHFVEHCFGTFWNALQNLFRTPVAWAYRGQATQKLSHKEFRKPFQRVFRICPADHKLFKHVFLQRDMWNAFLLWATTSKRFLAHFPVPFILLVTRLIKCFPKINEH